MGNHEKKNVFGLASQLVSNSFCFCLGFVAFIISNHRSAVMVISQRDAHVLLQPKKMKQLKSHVRHDDPEIVLISHIHVLLCLLQLVYCFTDVVVVVSRPGA